MGRACGLDLGWSPTATTHCVSQELGIPPAPPTACPWESKDAAVPTHSLGPCCSLTSKSPPQVVRGLSAGTRVFEYMTLSPCIPLSGGSCVPRECLRGSVTFHHVCFRSVSVGGHR